MERMLFQSTYATKSAGTELDKLAEASRELVKEYVSKNIKANDIRFHSDVNAYFKNVEVDSYAEHNETLLKAILQYACKGLDYACETFADFQNRQLTTDPTFISRFNAVLAQAINPIVPDIVSESFMGLADVSYVGYGDTATFEIDNNDLFYVKEIAEGVQRGAMQRLYKNEVAVNPTPKQIRIELPWYEVVTGKFDLGQWMYKVGMSFTGYINIKVINAMTESFNDIPTAYIANGAFSDSNFIRLGQQVKAANGGKMVQVWGTLAALGNVMPSAEGLLYGLGMDYAKIGYIGTYKGLPLVEIEQAMKPGTVNTTAELLVPDNILYFVPVDSYNPVKIVFEGDSVTVEKEATKSSDKYLGLAITMRVAVSAVVGSIFGAYKLAGV